MNIKLDLTKLTQAHIDEALPHMGACDYAAPCIIGTLMTPDEQDFFANDNDKLDFSANNSIGAIAQAGYVRFPDPKQKLLAEKLQFAFDNHGKEDGPEYDFPAAVARLNQTLGLNLVVNPDDIPEHVNDLEA